jgi:acetyl-CoA C-acetyltransferase
MSGLVLHPGLRTAMGRFGGAFADTSPMHLAAALIRALPARLGFDPGEVREVFLGHCRQAGHGPNPARSAALWGGLPQQVPATTINMACPSGLLALRAALALHQEGVVLAGGMDSMSTIPYLLKGARFGGFRMGDRVLEDGWSDSRDPVAGMMMGETAELLADECGIGRAEQDACAAESQLRAARAEEAGHFTREILPVLGLERDETIRREVSLEQMAALKPAFRRGGSVTAGNACAMADAAAVLALAPPQRFPALPAFRTRRLVATAVDPARMGTGPAVAVRELLAAEGLRPELVGVLEINEAFAVQVLANLRELDWDPARANRWGGAIALGHPTGMSGARLLVTAMNQMEHLDAELGVAAICGAGGVTCAALLERIR